MPHKVESGDTVVTGHPLTTLDFAGVFWLLRVWRAVDGHVRHVLMRGESETSFMTSLGPFLFGSGRVIFVKCPKALLMGFYEWRSTVGARVAMLDDSPVNSRECSNFDADPICRAMMAASCESGSQLSKELARLTSAAKGSERKRSQGSASATAPTDSSQSPAGVQQRGGKGKLPRLIPINIAPSVGGDGDEGARLQDPRIKKMTLKSVEERQALAILRKTRASDSLKAAEIEAEALVAKAEKEKKAAIRHGKNVGRDLKRMEREARQPEGSASGAVGALASGAAAGGAPNGVEASGEQPPPVTTNGIPAVASGSGEALAQAERPVKVKGEKVGKTGKVKKTLEPRSDAVVDAMAKMSIDDGVKLPTSAAQEKPKEKVSQSNSGVGPETVSASGSREPDKPMDEGSTFPPLDDPMVGGQETAPEYEPVANWADHVNLIFPLGLDDGEEAPLVRSPVHEKEEALLT